MMEIGFAVSGVLLFVVFYLWRSDRWAWERERERLLDRIQAQDPAALERLDAHGARQVLMRQVEREDVEAQAEEKEESPSGPYPWEGPIVPPSEGREIVRRIAG